VSPARAALAPGGRGFALTRAVFRPRVAAHLRHLGPWPHQFGRGATSCLV